MNVRNTIAIPPNSSTSSSRFSAMLPFSLNPPHQHQPFHSSLHSHQHISGVGSASNSSSSNIPDQSYRMSSAVSSRRRTEGHPVSGSAFSSTAGGSLPITDSMIDTLLMLYFEDPLDISKIIQEELFRRRVTFRGTVFEEIDLFNHFEQQYYITEEDLNEKNYPTEIMKHTKNLILQILQQNDRFSPLVSFHILLYKRIQILEKVQEFLLAKTRNIKKLKQILEALPPYPSASQKEENIVLVKSLQKSMQKSDEKKGLFSILRKSRLETIYKLLSKNVPPLSMSTHLADVSSIRDYLLNYSLDPNNPRKRRSKAFMSLALLSLSRGYLLDMLFVLQSILSLSKSTKTLSVETTEDGGIFLRQEILKALQNFQQITKETLEYSDQQKSGNDMITPSLKLKQFNPETILQLPDYMLPSNVKKTAEVARLFVFILANLDVLCIHYLKGGIKMKKNTLAKFFVIETIPSTFDLLIDLLDNLLANFDPQADEKARIYSILAFMRLLHLNLETLSHYRKEKEDLNALICRISRIPSTASINFLSKIKIFLLAVLDTNESIPLDQKDQDLFNKTTAQSPESCNSDKVTIEDQSGPVDFVKSDESLITTPSPSEHEKSDLPSKIKDSNIHNNEQKEDEISDDFVLVSSPNEATNSRMDQSSNSKKLSNDISSNNNSNDNNNNNNNNNNKNNNNNVKQQQFQPSKPYHLSSEYSNTIRSEAALILCSGFSFFYPTFKEQYQFVLNNLKSLESQTKILLLETFLERITTHDLLLFEQFMVKGLDMKETTTQLIGEMLDFLYDHECQKLNTLSPSPIDRISSLLIRLLVMWQNHILFSITPRYSKIANMPSLPTTPLDSGIGNVLVTYTKSICNSSSRLIKLACTLMTKRQIDSNSLKESIRNSIAGRLLLPLLQGFVKIIWRCGNIKNDIQQMEALCSFLFPLVLETIQSVNDLNIILGVKQGKTSDWQIVETNHPYESKLDEKIVIDFESNDVLGVAIKFDPRCKTAIPHDSLSISSPNAISISEALRIAGSGKNIPALPLMTWGRNMSVHFSSTDKNTDWGMRCAIFPVHSLDWSLELEKTTAWIGSRCASFFLSSYPSFEDQNTAAWLSCRLFSNGLESDGKNSADNTPKSSQVFLEDLIENRNEAANLVNYMYKQLPSETMFGRNEQDILQSERGLIAAILKHTDLTGIAMSTAKHLLHSDNLRIPKRLLYVFRIACKNRPSMLIKKQQMKTDYATLRQSMINRVRFLLRVRSATYFHTNAAEIKSFIPQSRIPMRDAIENVDSETRKGKQKSSLTNGPRQPVGDETLDILHKLKLVFAVFRYARKWKKRALELDEDVEIDVLSPIVNEVVRFVNSNETDALKLENIIKIRVNRAINRSKAFQMFTELLNSTKIPSVKTEIIHTVKHMTRTRSMKKFKSIDFHFFNNLEGCGPAVFQRLVQSFTSFIKEIVLDLESDEADILLTGFLREAMDILSLSFSINDIEWIISLDFLQKLVPFMYSIPQISDQDDQKVKLKKKAASIVERRDMIKKSWKIFRLFALRCINMIGEWDMSEKYKVAVFKRCKVKQKLETLTDSIFHYIFDKLEEMIEKKNMVQEILEEILSLIISLGNTESAQRSLCSSQFQTLLIPLIRSDYPKVQRLALRLCDQLILNMENNRLEIGETSCIKLLQVLFDLLGSYEIFKVTGIDVKSPKLAGLKNIKIAFQLMRKLFTPEAPSTWRKMINCQIQNSLANCRELLCLDNLTVCDDEKYGKIKQLLATFTILLGFAHTASVGDKVKVLIDGTWEICTVVAVEENIHAYQVEFDKGNTKIPARDRVYAEDTRVLTDEFLSNGVSDISSECLEALCDMIESTSNSLLSKEIFSELDENSKLLAAQMWKQALKLLNQWILADERVLENLLTSNQIDRLTHFASLPTKTSYGKRLALNSCSYAFTGKVFTRQYYYSCLTCGMSNSRAVCAFCAKTCHRGHRLGMAEVGEFYCDCGAGEGKCPCISLKFAPDDRTLNLDRMESLLIRMQQLMPLYSQMKQDHPSMQTVNSMSDHDPESSLPTKFVSSDDDGYIISNQNEIIFSKQTVRGYSILGTDKPLSTSVSGFYFETFIQSCDINHSILIGFTEKVIKCGTFPEILQSAYSLNICSGNLLLGRNLLKSNFCQRTISSDIIGCGWNKQQNTIYFTRNGISMGQAFTVPNTVSHIYPMIVLLESKTVVKTNFGEKAFRYPVSKFYGALPQLQKKEPAKKQIMQHKQQLESNIMNAMKELEVLGFSKKEIELALQKYPNDLNAAAAWIYRSKDKPIRHQLADQLLQMGFTNKREDCIKALMLNNDDLTTAANWLIDGGLSTLDNNTGNEESEENTLERGLAFLGADISESEIESLVMKGMLQDPALEVNENGYSDIQPQKIATGNLIVIDPYLSEEGVNINSPLTKIKGTFGVIIRKMVTGWFIQSIDLNSGSNITDMVVNPNHILTPPPELRDVSVYKIADTALQYMIRISIFQSRAILANAMKRSSEKMAYLWYNNLPPPHTMYQHLKSIFVEQYHQQENIFSSKSTKLTSNLDSLVKKMKNIKYSPDMSLFDQLSDQCLTELNQYIGTMPNYRRVVFNQQMNNVKIPIRFWGASSLCISFVGRCELNSAADTLSFYFDVQGKKKMKQYKGPLSLPRRICISGDRFWFEFKTTSVAEGFQFFVTPSTYRISEKHAINQPNIQLASLILKNVSDSYWDQNPEKICDAFNKGLKYIMIPFAPFKTNVVEALSSLCVKVSQQSNENCKEVLTTLKHFRLELEDSYRQYVRYHERDVQPLPVFHSMVDFMSTVRQHLTSDLCISTLSQSPMKHHQYKITVNSHGKHIRTCTACTMTSHSYHVPKYHSQTEEKCHQCSANQLYWRNQSIATTSKVMEHSNLVPIGMLNINPSDWFEHVSWIDQLAIVRQICECFVSNRDLPYWILFEAALETKKKVTYKESPHPYNIIKDEDMIHIPGAKTLFLSFDKHSKTHKCDRLFFSSTHKYGTELGSYGGEELRDKTIIVHGDKVFYHFKSIGGDHSECTCNHCGNRIQGIRYRCTECDNYDLCSACIKFSKIHFDTHLFLKIRRPVDCVPAALPHLYTARWGNSHTFKGTTHTNVKCNACGMNPIKGIRYWCENCDDYNLCEKCAEEEYKHHDRMHVFLRVVRPLPPKSQLPPNALPYGLVYEKELDTHWGYLFSVSSSDSLTRHDDPSIRKLMKEIHENMKQWSGDMDEQLVEYIETFCNGWQSLEYNGLKPNDEQLFQFPKISKVSLKSLRFRFILLKLLNRKISRILNLLDLSSKEGYGKDDLNHLAIFVSRLRRQTFKSVKMDVWNHTLSKTLIEISPITLKLNRLKSSEEVSDATLYQQNSMFMQAYQQVQAINPKVLSRKGGAWKVILVGEAADDYGGPFRDSITQMCTELQSKQISLLIPVPNFVNDSGDFKNKHMPNPQCVSYTHQNWFKFMGIILGIGLLSKNVLPLDLPSIVWKQIVMEEVKLDDLRAIDQETFKKIDMMRNPENYGLFEFNFEGLGSFTARTSDDREIELIAGGKAKEITFENRLEYANLLESFRLNEVKTQIENIRVGFYSIITPRFIPIFSWHEIENLICGSPDIDLDVLKKHTIYEGYNANSREVKDFWNVMREFDSYQRSLYLRFVWGRSRLPITEDGYTHPMKIQKLERAFPDSVLPLSHTCFFSIEMPPYSSKKVMRERLLYAITHCKAIDTDFTTTATEARNLTG